MANDSSFKVKVYRKYKTKLPEGQLPEEPEELFIEKGPVIHKLITAISEELGSSADSHADSVQYVVAVHSLPKYRHDIESVSSSGTVSVSSKHNIKDVTRVIRNSL